MDTRAPPIAPRTQQQQQQDRCQQQQATTTTESEEVTLPPLANQQPQQRHRTKSTTANNWRNNNGPPPGLLKQQDIQRRRPYKVLAIGATPLMHACQQADRARVLKLLRDQEETIGYRDRALRSALHYCMDASTGGAVAQAAPELVDAPDGEGHTPLHLAVIAGDTQLVAVLLANGADVNAKDLEGHSVLHWATVCGEVECVRLVLAAGARPSAADHRGGSALHYAAQCCGAAATAELAVPKKVGLKVLQTLLEFGADVNARDEDGRQPILWAASAGSVEAILALVRAGGSAVSNASDKDGLTALHCAASRGHARCIETLVNLCDAQPDHVDDNGCSALHYAATLGHADATALLLKLGADPNRQDRKGRTPALCAAAKGQLETLKILSQHGGSLHARTVRGTGVAHEAVASGRLELVKWLIKRKPSLLDVATQDGKTPLHVAALHGHLDACKLLLDSGARINALLRTSKGAVMTALDAALYRGHRDCAKLIQMHGGFTAQHLSTHKSLASNKVFSSKLRVRHTESSSDSELNSVTPRSLQQRQHHRNRDPDMYYEERWVERRTRRRANRRRLSRQDSRSYSEEELRHHSKASTTVKSTERQRRALSENARYDEAERDLDDDLDDEDHQRRGSRRRKDDKHFKRKKSGKTTGESAASGGGGESESEDSSESSTKSDEEGSSVSDDSLEVVIVKRCLEKTSEKIISGRKSKTPRDDSKSSKTSDDKSKSSSKKDQQDHKSKRDKSPPTAKPRKLSGQAQQQEEKAFDGDSTSQDTVEQVTVTVDVHKTGPPLVRQPEAGETTATEQEMDEQMKSKMEDILEKADELQSALLTKAADLKKDVEEMRHQMAQKSESDDKKECSGDTKSYTTTTTSTGTFESTESSSAKEETPNLEAKRKSLDQQQQQQQPSQEAPIAKPETTTTDSDQVEIKTTEVTDQDGKSSITVEVTETKRGSLVSKTQIEQTETKQDTAEVKESKAEQEPPKKNDKPELQTQSSTAVTESSIPGAEALRFADESSSSSPAPGKLGKRARPTTGKRRGLAKPNISTTSGTKSSTILFESSTEERSPDRSAIVAVIESPEWDEEDDEEIDKEIRDVVGDGVEEHDEEEDDLEEESDGGEDDGGGIVRVLPSSEDDILGARNNGIDALPQLQPKGHRLVRVSGGHQDCRFGRHQRHDSGGGGGGRDSGIEPSPRVSRIPKRQLRCCPNTERQQALHMDTITRDVQISLRRYHLERKIFFQLMELKRLQIRNGRSNEQVLVKRQVDAFNRAGMSGPALGVSKYDQPYTFRAFETFLYEQLRRLQKRPATPDFCTEARQCTQRTHRCHHATSAYTSVPIYTYLGGGGQERPQSILPRIEGRGKGHMTVELTHGQEKQVIALPSEKLDRTKRYYVTFTVRGETADSDKSDKVPLSSAQLRQAKSI